MPKLGQRQNLIGWRFGQLVVIGEAQDRFTPSGHRTVYWRCRCDCGNECEVRAISLKRQDRPTWNCGCHRRTRMSGNRLGWKGGRRRIEGGYVEVYQPDHPMARANGYIKEHRLVMEAHLGRYLTAEETVHHLNGKRDDNRLENLELWNHSHPSGQRIVDLLAWAERIIQLYG